MGGSFWRFSIFSFDSVSGGLPLAFVLIRAEPLVVIAFCDEQLFEMSETVELAVVQCVGFHSEEKKEISIYSAVHWKLTFSPINATSVIGPDNLARSPNFSISQQYFAILYIFESAYKISNSYKLPNNIARKFFCYE